MKIDDAPRKLQWPIIKGASSMKLFKVSKQFKLQGVEMTRYIFSNFKGLLYLNKVKYL